MPIVLIAQGGDLLIPCLLFKSMEEGISFMEEQGFSNPEQNRPEGAKAIEHWWTVNALGVCLDDLGETEQLRAFFTKYYGGCGGVHAFVLREIEYSKPFVHWDLD